MPETRFALPDDLPRVGALIARLNAQPATESLHCAARTAAGVQRALLNKEDFPYGWEKSFAVTVDSAGEIVGVLGAQLDPDGAVGWLWGPWLAVDDWWPLAGAELLNRLLPRLPKSVRRIEAFLNSENRAGLAFLRAHRFHAGPATHLYVVPRNRWSEDANLEPFPALRPAHEVAFARLHADTFPASASTPAQALLDGRDAEHVIFAATDGLRLLGSICVSINHAPQEGFIDYLAVKPAVRGRGIGAGLLRTGLHWIFQTQRLPQAALCVTNWREGARRLYEQAGFTLQATGIAMRRQL